MNFVIRWPDGSVDACYSPSLVIREHLTAGESYPLGDFVARVTRALAIASERVEEKYGSPCSLAIGQSQRIVARAKTFASVRDAAVVVEAFS